MKRRLNPIILRIGRAHPFIKIVQEDRNQALQYLQGLQHLVDQASMRYQATHETGFEGTGFQLSFPSIPMALRTAQFIQQGLADFPLNPPLILSGRESLDRDIQTTHLPGEVLVQNELKSLLVDEKEWEIHPFDPDTSFSILRKSVGSAPRKTNKIYRKRVALILLACLMVISIAWFSRPHISPGSNESLGVTSLQKKSIAVIPFHNLNARTDSILVEGMMDEIRSHLSKMQGLKVISRNSSMKYASSSKGIDEIARELQVEYILEGSISAWDDRIKIAVQLINMQEDEQLWGETYERKLKDVFAIQSDVAQEIARTLRQNISPELSSSIDRAPTDQLEAYQELMASRALNRIRTQRSMEESLTHLDLALTIDPEYADALAEKATTLEVMGSLGYIEDQDSVRSEAEYYALQAIKLDPLNSRAYATLGNIYAASQKWDQSETAFQIAIQNKPNDALANYWYSLNLRYLGRLEEAIHYGGIAAELDPLYPVIQTGHALTCMIGDRMDLAEEIIDKGAVLFQNYFGYHWIHGYYYMCIGDYHQAIKTFNRSQELSPTINSIQRQIMFCKGKLGEVEEVEAYIRSQTGEDPLTYINLASAYSGLGRDEECIKYLQLLAASGNTSPSDSRNIKFRDVFHKIENQDILDQLRQTDNSAH